jgi:hypothetical protein
MTTNVDNTDIMQVRSVIVDTWQPNGVVRTSQRSDQRSVQSEHTSGLKMGASRGNLAVLGTQVPDCHRVSQGSFEAYKVLSVLQRGTSCMGHVLSSPSTLDVANISGQARPNSHSILKVDEAHGCYLGKLPSFSNGGTAN